MAGRTALTPKALKTPYSDVSANDLDFAFAAADQANGNAFPFSGREVILLQNSGVSPATVTLASAPDTYGRTKDIATYSLAAGEFAAFWAGAITGWRQSDGMFYINASATDIKIAVLRLPE